MTMAPGLLNERWLLVMPEERVRFWADRPHWEVGRMTHMAERLEPGMVVYDVGAEHGDMSAFYAQHTGSVVLVEPSAPYWPCMRAIFEANALPPPKAWFAGFAADTTHRIGADYGEGWPPMAEGRVRIDPGFQHLAQGEHISRIRIDDLARLAGLPDVIVLDIEGAEYHALSGALDCLRYKPVLVYVSVHDIPGSDPLGTWYGKTAADIDDLMASVGYVGTELPAFGEGERFMFYERA